MKKLHSVRTIILVGSLLLRLRILCFHSCGAAGGLFSRGFVQRIRMTIILAGSLLLQLNTLCFQSRGAAGGRGPLFDPAGSAAEWLKHPMADLGPMPQINHMTNYKNVVLVAASAAILSVLTPGCDRTISHTEKSSVDSDGTVKSKETTVTEHPDGSVTKSENQSKITTNSPR